MMDMTLEQYLAQYGKKRLAKKLDYSYNYIHMLAKGDAPITAEVRKRLRRLKPVPKTITTRWSGSEADRKLVLDTLTNSERERVLLKAAKERTHCGHPVSAIVSADEGTAYCAMCEEEEE